MGLPDIIAFLIGMVVMSIVIYLWWRSDRHGIQDGEPEADTWNREAEKTDELIGKSYAEANSNMPPFI